MAKKRAGWERMIYYGNAGTAAATLIEYATDIDVNSPKEFAETTTRGDGTTLPKKTEQVVQLATEVSFKYIYRDGDAVISALIAAERTGTTRAIKVLRYSGGETEFDGDCYFEMNSPGPLTGGMEIEFTCHPTDDDARAWAVG